MFSRIAVVGALALALVAPALTPATAADPTVTVSGRVTAAGTTPPRPLHVTWWEPRSGKALGEGVMTASDGTYTLEVPATATDWVLAANHADGDLGAYAPAFVGDGGRADYAWQGVPLIPDATADATVDIDLDRRGSVVGTTDVFTKGLARASLHYPDGRDFSFDDKEVRADGTFLFRYLVPGRYRVAVHPQHPEREPTTTSGVITVRPGEEVRVDLPTAKGGVLTGRLLGYGKPVAGVPVSLSATDTGRTARSTTDAKGRYRFAGLPVGTYRVREDGKDNGWSSGTAQVRVTGGATTTRDLRLDREGAVVVPSSDVPYLYLTDTSGAKLRDLTARRFTVAPGTYYVYTAHARWGRTLVTVRAGKVTTTGHLRADRPLATVRGTVTGGDPSGKRLVSVCDVVCRGTATTAWAGSDGAYVVRNVVPGPVTITVDQPGWLRPTTATRIGTQATTTVTLRLPARASGVTGRLTSQGAPVAGTVLLSQKGRVVLRQAVGSDGRLATGPQLEPGTYRVEVEARVGAAAAPAPRWYTMPSGLTTITVERGRTLDLGAVALRLNG